jgi:hypothetical protein
MSGLRMDMPGVNQICPAQARIYLIRQDYTLWKNRSGAKTINLGPDKLTTCKQDTIERL